MNVRLDGELFRVGEGANSFTPSAAEIYSVVFEDAKVLRGTPVTAEDFQKCGVIFTEYVADPFLILEVEARPEGQTIFCRFRARSGSNEANVAQDADFLLDYAIGSGGWMPLPAGAVDEARKVLDGLGAKSFGAITLAQYLKISRLRSPGVSIEDRTANALSAASVAPSLQGELPTGFIGKLYGYQLDGFRWLSFMVRSGLGGIIADEMGLGKTVQVICVLLEASARKFTPNL